MDINLKTCHFVCRSLGEKKGGEETVLGSEARECDWEGDNRWIGLSVLD